MVEYLKKAVRTAETGRDDVRAKVETLLADLEVGGDDVARRLAAEFDHWDGEILVSEADLEAAEAAVPERLKNDIQFAHDNIRRFAEAQKSTIADCEIAVVPG